ncbi:MAG: hypothetical protein NVSMB27_39370 [Ktedonobacteraceae bacterium]
MSTVAQIKEVLQRVLGPRADELARETHFVRRKRQLDGSDFVQGVVFGLLHQANASTEELAQIEGASRGGYQRIRTMPTLYPSRRRVLRAGVGRNGPRGHPSRAASSRRTISTL